VQYVRKCFKQQQLSYQNPNYILDAKYSLTIHGQQFLRSSSILPRLILFMSDFQLSYFRKIEHNNELFMDGTFKIAPKEYSQLYIIHMKKGLEHFQVSESYVVFF